MKQEDFLNIYKKRSRHGCEKLVEWLKRSESIKAQDAQEKVTFLTIVEIALAYNSKKEGNIGDFPEFSSAINKICCDCTKEVKTPLFKKTIVCLQKALKKLKDTQKLKFIFLDHILYYYDGIVSQKKCKTQFDKVKIPERIDLFDKWFDLLILNLRNAMQQEVKNIKYIDKLRDKLHEAYIKILEEKELNIDSIRNKLSDSLPTLVLRQKSFCAFMKYYRENFFSPSSL